MTLTVPHTPQARAPAVAVDYNPRRLDDVVLRQGYGSSPDAMDFDTAGPAAARRQPDAAAVDVWSRAAMDLDLGPMMLLPCARSPTRQAKIRSYKLAF